jgi:hypothetical protein
VVDGEREADALAAELRAGADFAAAAREKSIHASAGDGGRIPFPLLPADVNDARVRDALLVAAPGTVVGPFPTEGGGRTVRQIYRVEARAAARDEPYEALAAGIERELSARPVDVGEYERWRRRILLRHGFIAAAGEPS